MKCRDRVARDSFHVDHLIPVSKGGPEWELSNLELSCAPCNLRKGAKMGTPLEGDRGELPSDK